MRHGRTVAERRLRQAPAPGSEPISELTYARLLAALEAKYPGQWRRAVDVCPVAVNKTIDNEADALETIRRINEALSREATRRAMEARP